MRGVVPWLSALDRVLNPPAGKCRRRVSICRLLMYQNLEQQVPIEVKLPIVRVVVGLLLILEVLLRLLYKCGWRLEARDGRKHIGCHLFRRIHKL